MKSKRVLLTTLIVLFITGCAQNPNRAGCTYIDGSGRTGSITQYAKGDIKGVHIYIGKNVSGVTITCTSEKQEVKTTEQAEIIATDE